MKKGHTVSVLDKGWIELQDVMGDDLAIVNAARTSMLGESKGPEQDKKLLFYLMSHGHTSPFEQCLSGDTLIPTFPCVGAKQKYYSMEQLAEAFGRMSKSDAWAKLVNIRTVNANGVVEPTRIKNVRMTGVKIGLYEEALQLGIAKEQARLFLPAWCSYYTWVCKVDAHNLMHFLKLRMAKEAQFEIRVYAQAIYDNFFKPLLPWTAEAFEKFVLKGGE